MRQNGGEKRRTERRNNWQAFRYYSQLLPCRHPGNMSSRLFLGQLNHHLLPGKKFTNSAHGPVRVERLINLFRDSIDIYISPNVYPVSSKWHWFWQVWGKHSLKKTGILYDIEPDIKPLKHVKKPYSPRPTVCLSGFPACVLSNGSLNHIPFL